MMELGIRSFLSAAVDKVIERLVSGTFVSFFRAKKSIDEQLTALKWRLETASLLLNDAEDREMSDLSVKKWLDELKDVILRADDLMEEINDRAQSKQECKSRSTRKLITRFISPDEFSEFDKTVQAEIAIVLGDLDSLLDKRFVLGLKEDAQKITSSLRIPAALRDERHVYGRDADKEEVCKLLLSNDDVWGNKICVLPIVGMGGLGKTTLAQLVYNHDVLKEHGFEHKAWVTVSAKFDIFRIEKSILQQVTSQITSGTEEPLEVEWQLKEALRGKKFLFVLDDVWDEDSGKWDALMSTFMFGKCGSWIIVTTRSQDVALFVNTGRIYELSQLSDKDAWKILVDHAFNGSDLDADPLLLEIGKRIAKKCKGLPLGVKSVGGLLRSQRNLKYWESILRSHAWEWCTNQSNGILPSLWLSYRYLPSCLKQCFAFCSIFPKDYEFQKRELILLWMAQGFLQSDQNEKRLEEVGEEYFNILLSRSLFQKSRHSKSRFVMHDLVHDLAVFVSSEFCLRLDEHNDLDNLTSKTRHLSHNISIDHSVWTILSRAKHLRTFIGSDAYASSQIIEKLISKGRFLRAFSPLMDNWSWMMPNSFGNLKQLRYLNLSCNEFEELPCSICTLCKLQTLLLSNCKRLTRLPTNMERLTNLRHLDTTFSPLQEMPPRMGKLKELQTLTEFVLSSYYDSSSIKELGELQNLGGKLCISGLQNVVDVEDALKAKLRDKEHLSKLTFQWKGHATDPEGGKEVLDALQPHTNLEKLTICGYKGVSFPNWVGDSSFSKMVSVRLSGNEYCLFLPPLGQLPSLGKLVIEGYLGVERIGAEFYIGNNSSITPFQSLEVLKFIDMKNWKEWSFIGRDGKEVGCFPRLRQLSFDGCPNLAGSLPHCDTVEILQILGSYNCMDSLPLDKFPKLKELELNRCQNLKTLTGDSSGVIEILDIGECNQLEVPENQHFKSVIRLEIYGCDSLNSLPLNCFPRLEELCLYKCRNLKSLTFTEESDTALQSLISYLVVVDCKNFRSLPEHLQRLHPSLSYMSINNCPEIESLPKEDCPLI